MQPVGIGIIGTGNISDAYLKAAPKFPVLKIVACADINMDAAQAKAATYGIEALTVDALLADPRISIVLNLTTPQHHVPVGLQAIAAGKHVYSEKPLAIALGGRPAPRRRRARQRAARRLRARHLPRRLAPDRTPGDRCRRHRHAACRHRLHDGPRPRALAPQPGFLLQARRRTDVRHGSLLPHLSRQHAGAGGECLGRGKGVLFQPHRGLGSTPGRELFGRRPDAYLGDDDLPVGRGGHHHDVLRRLEA